MKEITVYNLRYPLKFESTAFAVYLTLTYFLKHHTSRKYKPLKNPSFVHNFNYPL